MYLRSTRLTSIFSKTNHPTNEQPNNQPLLLNKPTMSSFNASTASWDTLTASLDCLSMVAEPKTPEPAYMTAETHNGWDIANLTAEELYEVLRPIENWREAERCRRPGAARRHFDQLCKHILSLNNPKAEIERLLRDGPPDAPKSQKYTPDI